MFFLQAAARPSKPHFDSSKVHSCTIIRSIDILRGSVSDNILLQAFTGGIIEHTTDIDINPRVLSQSRLKASIKVQDAEELTANYFSS